MTKLEFIKEIKNVVDTKPATFRNGQAVFNYIDSRYGVAHDIKERGVDCYYDDDQIEMFVNMAYNIIKNGNVHDFPGNNMIEE